MFSKNEMRKKLSCALKNRELYAVFQPKVDVTNNQIYSLEALIRWHYQGQDIPLSTFYTLLQSDLLGHQVFKFIIKESLDMHKKLLDEGLTCAMSINVSNPTLKLPHAAEEILELLEKSHIDKAAVKLEILECVDIFSDEIIQDNLKRLKASGIPLILDDFGSGEFFLKNIQLVDFDAIKIDREICLTAQSNNLIRDIISSVVVYGQQNSKVIIAEGIETEPQQALMRSQGVEVFQGYLFARPMAQRQVLPWLNNFYQQAAGY
ncbi:EAL domain-containing protein [Pantoea osteomyelitidis]|uniref:EAL domain-containing protein n=1 Tax=Pantoea osteomyelitidis TaxID=3230026 RepID=A0ABW7PYW8_9GAMM